MRHFLLLAAAICSVPPAVAQPTLSNVSGAATWADVADLADSAPVVVRAQVRKLARVAPTTAGGVAPQRGRFYVEARTVSLLSGQADLAPALAFLADLPLDARGKPPALKRRDVLLFARPVAGRPGELALVAPDAMLAWTPETDARARAVLTALVAPDAPRRVTGVREIIHVPGTLAGEGDTQVFLTTSDGSAASLLVQHRPGQPPRWGASFSELTADIDNPPQRDTLAWYRLACFLPRSVPASANLSESDEARAIAAEDYRMVMAALGDCTRSRR